MIKIPKVCFSDKLPYNLILQSYNISDELCVWNYVKPNYLSKYILIRRWWFSWWYIRNFFLIIILLWPKTSRIINLWDPALAKDFHSQPSCIRHHIQNTLHKNQRIKLGSKAKYRFIYTKYHNDLRSKDHLHNSH